AQWRSCADLRLLSALPSLCIKRRRSNSREGLCRQSVSLLARGPHLLRLEDGTETPGLAVLASSLAGQLWNRQQEPMISSGRFLLVTAEPIIDQQLSACGETTTPSLSVEDNADDLYVNGVEVTLDGCDLLPGSAIVCGRCVFLFCWGRHNQLDCSDVPAARFLASQVDVAALRRDNSDLRARARDLTEAAGRADSLAVRISAAVGRLENALFQQQQHQQQTASPLLAACSQSPSREQEQVIIRSHQINCVLIRSLPTAGQADSKIATADRNSVLLTAPPELLRSTVLHRPKLLMEHQSLGELALLSLSNSSSLIRHQFLLGISADVCDKLVVALNGINECCTRQWLFDRICEAVAEIGWTMTVAD
uniref:ACT domain-containing protein n=1 Tax=Macrostomum lignano TaxID=282301 RepID=A0A1I8HUJ4_9PLAT